MPKKGGKRVVDVSKGGDDAAGPEAEAATKSAAVPEPELAAAAPAPAQAAAKEEESAQVDAAAPAAVPVAEPAVVFAPMSARQNKAAGAWNAHQKEVDRHFTGFFEGVGSDVGQVDKGLQSSALAARETHKNVGIAKAYLAHISQALESVDTLVVPIVLQREGNF